MTDPGQQDISNELNVTVLFPDSNGVHPTNGLFASQEEFRKFMFENDLQRMKATFYTKPTPKRQKDYVDDEFVKAFPVQFPFGFGGFPRESAGHEFFGKGKARVTFRERYQHYLRHRKRTFHEATFNLVGNGILMRHGAFENVRLQCNLRFREWDTMGNQFGEMSALELQNSVIKARTQRYRSVSNSSDRFLSSITAVSRSLPHSNEATLESRKQHFSF